MYFSQRHPDWGLAAASQLSRGKRGCKSAAPAHLLLQGVPPQLHHLQPVQQRRRDVSGAVGGGDKQRRREVKGLWELGQAPAGWREPSGSRRRAAMLNLSVRRKVCRAGRQVAVLTRPRYVSTNAEFCSGSSTCRR